MGLNLDPISEMSPAQAEAQYPHAWLDIQDRIAEVRRSVDEIAIVPLTAYVTADKGEMVLRFVAITDIDIGNAESAASAMTFQALIGRRIN